MEAVCCLRSLPIKWYEEERLMKVAFLGWGSLIWCPGALRFAYEADGPNQYRGWYTDGPELPIEFARVSRDGRLTLVVHRGSRPVPALWALSSSESLDDSKKNLRCRESCANECIGIWQRSNTLSGKEDDITAQVERWALSMERLQLDAVLWTDLKAKAPEDVPDWLPTMEQVQTYIRETSGTCRAKCIEYIRSTPPQVQTGLRQALEDLCSTLSHEL